MYTVKPVGLVRSPLVRTADAPKQGDEGAPDAWIDVSADYEDALSGIAVGDELLILTWLHQADREVLMVHPRGDRRRPLTGVFATRSPARPNPVGVHRVTVLGREGRTVKVGPLEAVDGTPVIDIKPVLGEER